MLQKAANWLTDDGSTLTKGKYCLNNFGYVLCKMNGPIKCLKFTNTSIGIADFSLQRPSTKHTGRTENNSLLSASSLTE